MEISIFRCLNDEVHMPDLFAFGISSDKPVYDWRLPGFSVRESLAHCVDFNVLSVVHVHELLVYV